jgi:hypothetical protein
MFPLSSSKLVTVRGVPSVGLDTADGEAPDREDIFARSHTETFFAVCFTLTLERLSRFFTFHRSLDLRCFLATFLLLLFGILCSSVLVDCLNDCVANFCHLALCKYKFSPHRVKAFHTLIENNVWISTHCRVHLFQLVDVKLRREVLQSIPCSLPYCLWNLWCL